MKKLVVLSGAGMSADSGISTFRDQNGLWENHDIFEVATPEAWQQNPALVLNFYNQRRKQLFEVSPNAGHLALVELEKHFDVHIITQNVDDLHERAGSKNILHLHGELKKVRSTKKTSYTKTLEGWELNLGDLCPEGSQLRPHIVWFGEDVPNINVATSMVETAEVLLIIGTSLNVYPAAGLVEWARKDIPIYVIDPNPIHIKNTRAIHIKNTSAIGLPKLTAQLINLFN